MREDKFKIINNLFASYFELEANKINSDFNYVSCRTYSTLPPNDDPKHGSFGLYLDCILSNADLDKSDNISLGILAYDQNEFTINAEICWGYPGKIEAEVFEEPAGVTEHNLGVIKEKLPDLVSKLRKLIQENPNGN